MSTALHRVADVATVLATVRRCLPCAEGRVALHEPTFDGNEWTYVKECLDTGWVSSAGGYVERFEEALAAYTGVERAVAVVNGTAALHIALLLAGVRQQEEVIVPALTFVATANAVAHSGAVPHFVDSEIATLGLDASKLGEHLRRIAAPDREGCVNRQTGRRMRAVVPMHTFGHPVDLDPLAAVCDDFGLVMVEDAAEALGSLYKGRHVGQWGKLATLSFNGNKTITTGGGGAILTDDPNLADEAKHLTTTAKQPHPWAYMHDRVGYNYRLPNINAALGTAQLEQLPGLLDRKRTLAARYERAFCEMPGVTFVCEPAFARSNYWLNTLLLDNAGARDALLAQAHADGLLMRPAWMPLHQLPMFAACPRGDLATAESLAARIVNLPSSPSLA